MIDFIVSGIRHPNRREERWVHSRFRPKCFLHGSYRLLSLRIAIETMFRILAPSSLLTPVFAAGFVLVSDGGLKVSSERSKFGVGAWPVLRHRVTG
jgi:hypothetical protein